jgi:hypothetical protein
MNTIANACNRPLFEENGTVPDVSGALQDYFQPMVFEPLVKTAVGFQAVENATPINFRGTIQPFNQRQLMLKPEGERAWTWFTLHSDPVLTLQVDDVVKYLGKQTRVMGRKNFSLYGYVEYEIVQDWTGSGP